MPANFIKRGELAVCVDTSSSGNIAQNISKPVAHNVHITASILIDIYSGDFIKAGATKNYGHMVAAGRGAIHCFDLSCACRIVSGSDCISNARTSSSA